MVPRRRYDQSAWKKSVAHGPANYLRTAHANRALPEPLRGCGIHVPSRPTMVTVAGPTRATRSSLAHGEGTRRT
jgi:hypothetical protein